jgi:hypothetical protein
MSITDVTSKNKPKMVLEEDDNICGEIMVNITKTGQMQA